MKALECKPSAQFAYNYSINVLSKCSNIISHRSSKVDRHTRVIITSTPAKVDTSIIDLRRSRHRSLKVNTSISKIHVKGGNIAPTIGHRISSTTAFHSISIRRSYTRPCPYVLVHCIYGNSNTACDPTCALVMYNMPIYIVYMR